MIPTRATPADSLETLARRTGFSPAAVATMRAAVAAGGGTMAQFAHPEFGGAGQWMHGDMTMIADPGDHALRARVAALAAALADGSHDERATSDVATSSFGTAAADPFVALEKLATLHARGIVDAAEYAAKKRELLARI